MEGILDKSSAHAGIVADPSVDAVENCGRCHAGIVNNFATSLHYNFTGYETLFERRSGLNLDDHPELRDDFTGECGQCHATCGQCHVSRPTSVKGGLVQGHRFLPVPNQSQQCTACHGSRIGEEYTGSREGYAADVHYVQGGMNCMGCHQDVLMHGDGTVYETRYQPTALPRCENCHSDVADINSWHSQHWGELSCEVCHSQDYKSCNKCHVGGAGTAEPSYITFKMGRNPIPEHSEYSYVVLRHIPIAEDTYSPWGVTDLPGFTSMPTWKYASPHNILLWTARTDTTGGLTCGERCHNTPDGVAGWFLRQADLDAMETTREQEANRPYIVPDGPPPWGG